ncbi:MAG: DUF115 domain-containing protein [Treponema sp.]|jgi:hypothetical protein|nr:DUF115 domain-containing protein [Treponema sp.]
MKERMALVTPWDTNIPLIQKKFPGLMEKLGNQEPAGDMDLQMEASTAGEPTLVINGIHIHSRRDPVREGRRQAETITGQGPIIVMGFGLGYAAEAAALQWPDRPLIIVERHKEMLRKALETRDLGKLLAEHTLIFVLGGRSDAIIGALQLLENPSEHQDVVLEKNRGAPSFLRNRALMDLDTVWYADVERHINTWVSRDEVNMATLRRFGKRWVRNLARNMTAIRDLPGVGCLAGCLGNHRDIPVFLAAAGPSLDGIAPFLPEIAERCVVVGVDTSLRLLLKAGIDPDFILSVDPQYWNIRHLDRVPGPKTCLIAESAVYPPALRHPFARAFLCSSLFPLGRFIEDRLDPKGCLGAGGSVATTAWDFARVLGTSTIWIAGLDLSFPGLKTHFKGALFEERAIAESTRFDPVETRSVMALRDGRPFWAPAVQGGSVLTDRRLSLYAAWFESRISQYPGIQNYRLSDDGLAIPGMMRASMEALLALPKRRETINRLLGTIFARVDTDFTSPEHAAQRGTQYETALRELLEGLKNIHALAEKAADLAERAYRTAKVRAQAPGIQETLKKLDKTNQAITESTVKDVAGFLFPPVTELEANLESPPSQPLLRYLELSSKLYRSLAEVARYNLTVLSKRTTCRGKRGMV